MHQRNKLTTKKPLKKYLRFSGIAIQMGLTIYLGSLLGEWLDFRFSNKKQFFHKFCTLFAVFTAMFSVIAQVTKISNRDD